MWQGALTVASVAALREAAEDELHSLGLSAEPGSELQYMDFDFEEWTAMVSDGELGAPSLALFPTRPFATHSADRCAAVLAAEALKATQESKSGHLQIRLEPV